MTPRQAIDRLRGFCDDRERRASQLRLPAVLTIETVRGVIDHVDWPAEGLVIGEQEARILLALIDGRPVPLGDMLALTGRLEVLGG